MGTVIKIMNPRITLPTIRKDASDNFEQAVICVSDNNGFKLTLTFNPPACPIHLDNPMEWDKLQSKINNGLSGIRDSWVEFFYGFREKDSCSVEIKFHDQTSPICISGKDIISGLPENTSFKNF